MAKTKARARAEVGQVPASASASTCYQGGLLQGPLDCLVHARTPIHPTLGDEALHSLATQVNTSHSSICGLLPSEWVLMRLHMPSSFGPQWPRMKQHPAQTQTTTKEKLHTQNINNCYNTINHRIQDQHAHTLSHTHQTQHESDE